MIDQRNGRLFGMLIRPIRGLSGRSYLQPKFHFQQMSTYINMIFKLQGYFHMALEKRF